MTSSETQTKVETLRKELEDAIMHHNRMFRANHYFAMVLMVLTFLSSGLAALGAFSNWDNRIVGALGLLPGAIASVATGMHLHGRVNYHLRKTKGLGALRRRLLYECADPASGDDLATVANDWTRFEEVLRPQWEKEFALDFSPFMKQHDK